MSYDSSRQISQLAHNLTEDSAELQRLVCQCIAVRYLRGLKSAPGPTPGGISRPTEDVALDEARLGVSAELDTATQLLITASAYVKGVSAALDRALARWEGAPDGDGGIDGVGWPDEHRGGLPPAA